MPENDEEADFGDFEQSRNVPKFGNYMDFQQTYISMVTYSIPSVSQIILGINFLLCLNFQQFTTEMIYITYNLWTGLKFPT